MFDDVFEDFMGAVGGQSDKPKRPLPNTAKAKALTPVSIELEKCIELTRVARDGYVRLMLR